jgi:hypothetical protein
VNKENVRHRGRPRLPAEHGKRYPIAIRTTKELKERLEGASKASGRSLAQELEFRLERSFEIQDIAGSVYPLIARISDQISELGSFITAADALGGKTLADALGGKTLADALGGKTLADALGGKTLADTLGGKTLADTLGATMLAEALGAQRFAEPLRDTQTVDVGAGETPGDSLRAVTSVATRGRERRRGGER